MAVTIVMEQEEKLIACTCGAKLRYTQDDVVRFTGYAYTLPYFKGYGITCPACKQPVITSNEKQVEA